MIKNLIFDFGKVLVDYDFKLYVESFCPDPATRDRFMDCILTEDWMRRMDKQDVPFEETISILKDTYPDLSAEMDAFLEKFPDIVLGEVPGMRDLLTGLKKEGYRLYGLTNWCDRVHVTMSRYGIFDLLDGVVISSEVHEVKPFPQIYRILFEKFSLDPAECLFTDDKQENIDGSQAVGMDAVLFKNARQYESDLRRIISEKR